MNDEDEEETIIEQKYERNKSQQQETPVLPVIKRKTSPLTMEQIEKFFKATEDGSIERLEQLFDEYASADPNMTYFTESLLMAAIRRNRNEVAEYLIDKLAVNVQYTADLREFRLHTKIPVRHRTFSCRDLAYEKGMMELVDLIDITSDNVTPNIKRYLQNRVQTRLDGIHQSYLKHVKETNKHSPFQINEEKEKENRVSPTVNITNETIRSPSMLPIIHRPYKSRIEETIQDINATDKSFDETGKKTFRFSNYSLHFRLIETPDTKNEIKEQYQTKSTVPSLPIIPLTTSLSFPLTTTTSSSSRSISEASTRLSRRNSYVTLYTSDRRRPTISQLVALETKATKTTTSIQRSLKKRVNQNKIKHNYIPQPQHTLYNQPEHFMPVTLKSTAIGLSSDIRVIRD